MKIINEIINLYQKGESLEKISSTLYLTPAFVNYIIQLSKTCSEKEIMDKFKHMSEYRNPDISLEELKKLIYEGFMPYMMAYLLETDKLVIGAYLKKLSVRGVLRDLDAHQKCMETKRKYFKEEPLYAINELEVLNQSHVKLYTICESSYLRAYLSYEKAKKILYDYVDADGAYLYQDLATKYKVVVPTVGNYLNLRDKRKVALQILNEEQLQKLKEINKIRGFLGENTKKSHARPNLEVQKKLLLFQKNIFFWIQLTLEFHLSLEELAQIANCPYTEIIYQQMISYQDNKYQQALENNFKYLQNDKTKSSENYINAQAYVNEVGIFQVEERKL